MDLRQNLIESLHNNTFNDLVELRFLHLNGNPIKFVSKYYFDRISFPQLRELKLSTNNLRSLLILTDCFRPMRNIINLISTDAYVQFLPALPFPLLENINLYNNHITYIEDNAFLKTQNLKGVY